MQNSGLNWRAARYDWMLHAVVPIETADSRNSFRLMPQGGAVGTDFAQMSTRTVALLGHGSLRRVVALQVCGIKLSMSTLTVGVNAPLFWPRISNTQLTCGMTLWSKPVNPRKDQQLSRGGWDGGLGRHRLFHRGPPLRRRRLDLLCWFRNPLRGGHAACHAANARLSA